MVDERSFGCTLHRVQKRLHRAWLEASLVRASIPEGAYKGTELRQLLRAGRLMHTVQGWHAEPCKVRGDGAIGQQHTFFDEHVSSSDLGAHDRINLALRVEHDSSLGEIEVETPSSQALLTQDGGQM